MKYHSLRYLLIVGPAIATWLFNNIATAMISELPAPTKESTAKYTYWFKVLNRVVGNVARARSTTLEQSPNWSDAVQAHIDKTNGSKAPTPEVS